MSDLGDHTGSAVSTWAVDVVMPVFNERDWPRKAIDALSRAASRAGTDLRVVVVDDGSSDCDSVRVLDELAARSYIHLVRQPNQGRFTARVVGMGEARAPYVLLLDARVEVDEHALQRIRRAVEQDGPEVWNLDVTPARTGPGAAFWSGVTKVWWRAYFRDRRQVSFGVEEFDRFPKGTTAFFAPTEVLREATRKFTSMYADASLASDDTRLLREVAAQQAITVSPDVTCRHHNKTGTRAWVKQCYYRGTTFVDGYLEEPGRARPLLLWGGLAVSVAVGVGIRAPRVAAASVVGASAAAGALTRYSGGTPRETAAVTLLSTPFGVLFGAGIARGLRMAHGGT